MTGQTKLTEAQLTEFLHDAFVQEQVRDFLELKGGASDGTVVDVGGGCGFFAKALAERTGRRTRVIDLDPRSIELCLAQGVDGRVGNALEPTAEGDEQVVCFNLILHHLVGADERTTRSLQKRALAAWRDRGIPLFVNEYIYQSFIRRVSGRLIYEITSSALLSAIGRAAAKLVPVLRANTFGTGVRFRSHEEWRELFAEAGYHVVDHRLGQPETVAPPLRLLLIKTIRRDSFLLQPA
jgi:hypothetical protein